MKTPRQDPPKAGDRNDRLKVALQANIARRKAQTRARAAGDATEADATDQPDTGTTQD